MHPVLFRVFGSFEVHSFGVLVAAGCLGAVFHALAEARRRGLDEDSVRDLCFWTLIASFVGARLAYLGTAGAPVLADCIDALGAEARSVAAAYSACARTLRMWEGGLVFYGGVVAGVATQYFYAKRRGLDPIVMADVFAPALALGHGVGRLGCLLAGCCFGRPFPAVSAVRDAAAPGLAARVLGLRFPEGSIAFQDAVARGLLAPQSESTLPLHPTQLYESLGELGLYVFLVAYARRPGRQRGDTALAWLGAYALLRFVVEIFRGDVIRAYVLRLPTPGLDRLLGLGGAEPSFLSSGQAAALAALAAALVIGFVRSRARTGTATITSPASA